MTAIVFNTLAGAATEYDWEFQSITPTHAGDAGGLFLLGGDTDVGQPIVAEIRTPVPLRETTLKKAMELIYFSVKSTGQCQGAVFGESEAWRYNFPVRASGQSRCKVGRGIRENYLGFGFSNPDGQAFTIDRIEVLMHESKSRRI